MRKKIIIIDSTLADGVTHGSVPRTEETNKILHLLRRYLLCKGGLRYERTGEVDYL